MLTIICAGFDARLDNRPAMYNRDPGERPMYILREYFVAKPGQAGRLASLMKEICALAAPGKGRVLTDMTGEFNRVIMETEIGSLAELEERWKEYMSNPDWRARMKGYTELWETGGREILRVA